MNGTGWSRGLEVTSGGTGVVSHAGLVLLRELADRTGLTAGLPASTAVSAKPPVKLPVKPHGPPVPAMPSCKSPHKRQSGIPGKENIRAPRWLAVSLHHPRSKRHLSAFPPPRHRPTRGFGSDIT